MSCCLCKTISGTAFGLQINSKLFNMAHKTLYDQTLAYISITFLLYNTINKLTLFFNSSNIPNSFPHVILDTCSSGSLSMIYLLFAWFSLAHTSELTIFLTF